MSRIKDAIIDGTYSQEKEYIPDGIRYIMETDRLQKFYDRDIPRYLAELNIKPVVEEVKPRKVITKSARQLQAESDWAYDQMVDNRITAQI